MENNGIHTLDPDIGDVDRKVLEKVRKLIAKAEGTTNEHEADAFMQAANALMEKYAIEQAMLDATRPAEQQAKPMTMNITLSSDREFKLVQVQLLHTIAVANRCQSWYLQNVPIGVVAGFASDVRYVEMLFTSIYFQMEQQFSTSMKSSTKVVGKGTKGETKVPFKPLNKNMMEEMAKGPNYRIEFMRGYVSRINQRFAEMKEHTQSQALVLANMQEKVTDMINDMGLQFERAETNRSKLDPAARGAGATAANNANLKPGAGLKGGGGLLGS